MASTLMTVTHRGFSGDTAPIWLSDLGVSLVYGTPYEAPIALETVRRMTALLALVGANKVWVTVAATS